MTRYEQIKAMTIEKMAKKIIETLITDEYCKSDCGNVDIIDCLDEVGCCAKWLNEEV